MNKEKYQAIIKMFEVWSAKNREQANRVRGTASEIFYDGYALATEHAVERAKNYSSYIEYLNALDNEVKPNEKTTTSGT